MRFAGWLLLAACACHGQDARSLVARAVAADDHSDRLARDYTYKVRDQTTELDGAGGAKAVHVTVDEVLYIGGKRYFRPLEKDGKALPAAEAQKEQKKLDRAAAEAARLTPAERAKRIEAEERDRAKRRAEFKDIPDAYDFKLLGETVIAGRGAYEISAVPRTGFRGELKSILRNVQGTLWIDKTDFNWIKVEAEVLKPFSLGLFLARVGQGTQLSYEMMRVNDELWVPKDVSLKASARLALLKKINVEQKVSYSDYRKFQTDSRVLPDTEAPGR